MCNVFSQLTRLLMHIEYNSFCELYSSYHISNCTLENEFCLCSKIQKEFRTLESLLKTNGHIHFGCNGDQCGTINSMEALEEFVGVLARKKCKHTHAQ
jgi:hypothetical protein